MKNFDENFNKIDNTFEFYFKDYDDVYKPTGIFFYYQESKKKNKKYTYIFYLYLLFLFYYSAKFFINYCNTKLNLITWGNR